MKKSKNISKLYSVDEVIAHTDNTIEIAGNRLQKKVQSYSFIHVKNEDNLISR